MMNSRTQNFCRPESRTLMKPILHTHSGAPQHWALSLCLDTPNEQNLVSAGLSEFRLGTTMGGMKGGGRQIYPFWV